MNHERKAQRDIERITGAGQDGEPLVQYLVRKRSWWFSGIRMKRCESVSQRWAV